MKINRLIKSVTKDYIPVKKIVTEAKKLNKEITVDVERQYFELNTTLELYKIIKGMFMEEITKNKKITESLVKEGVLTTHKEIAKDKNGKEIEVDVVDQSMDDRIDLVPDDIQTSMIEKMVKSHKENIVNLNKPGYEHLLEKEKFELKVLEQFLPKEATKEDVIEYLNEYYPNGIDPKGMGKVIGEVKKAFERVDGKLVAECVKSKIA